jgi:hypothetical protein
MDCVELTPVSVEGSIPLYGDQQNSTTDIVLGNCVQHWKFKVKIEVQILQICSVDRRRELSSNEHY